MATKWQSVKLDKETFDAVTKLRSRIKMPVSFNALVNYLILVHGIAAFERDELKVRGMILRSDGYERRPNEFGRNYEKQLKTKQRREK